MSFSKDVHGEQGWNESELLSTCLWPSPNWIISPSCPRRTKKPRNRVLFLPIQSILHMTWSPMSSASIYLHSHLLFFSFRFYKSSLGSTNSFPISYYYLLLCSVYSLHIQTIKSYFKWTPKDNFYFRNPLQTTYVKSNSRPSLSSPHSIFTDSY